MVVDNNMYKVEPLPPSDLPPSDSADLVLEPANPAEYVQSSRLNADEWRGPLTLAQYMERENHLLAQDLTKDGKSTGWVLTSSKLPLSAEGNRPILASCETLPKTGLIAQNGTVTEVLVHGIGSVFSRQEYRGRGYGKRMMVELGKKMDSWQQKDGQRGSFSVLYSDIGSKFYATLGWKVFPSTHIHLAPMGANDYERAGQDFPQVEDLTAADLKDIPTAQYVREDLKTESENKPNAKVVAVVPDMDHFTWHHAREEFVAKALGKDFPKIKGAIHRPTGVALIWSRIFLAKQEDWQVHILHTVIPPPMRNSIEGLKALSALLLRAQREADAWGMLGGVEVWDPVKLAIDAAQNLRTEAQDKVEVIVRDKEHLCSLRETDGGNQEVIWKFNEKFGWC